MDRLEADKQQHHPPHDDVKSQSQPVPETPAEKVAHAVAEAVETALYDSGTYTAVIVSQLSKEAKHYQEIMLGVHKFGWAFLSSSSPHDQGSGDSDMATMQGFQS